jgi:hypothetical protein
MESRTFVSPAAAIRFLMRDDGPPPGVGADWWEFLEPAPLGDADKRELASRLSRAKISPRLLIRDPSLMLRIVEPGFRLALADCYRRASGR